MFGILHHTDLVIEPFLLYHKSSCCKTLIFCFKDLSDFHFVNNSGCKFRTIGTLIPKLAVQLFRSERNAYSGLNRTASSWWISGSRTGVPFSRNLQFLKIIKDLWSLIFQRLRATVCSLVITEESSRFLKNTPKLETIRKNLIKANTRWCSSSMICFPLSEHAASEMLA